MPLSRLDSSEPLKIAVRIEREAGLSAIDAPEIFASTGFYTSERADQALRWSIFFGSTRHVAAFGLFLLMALIFRSALLANGSAYDYVVGSQFATLLATVSLLSLDGFTRVIPLVFYYKIQFAYLLLEGVFAFRMAMAVIRSRRQLSVRSTIALIAGFGLILLAVPSSWIESYGIRALVSFYLPLVYFTAAGLIVWFNRRDLCI